jgi:hypothetical protein
LVPDWFWVILSWVFDVVIKVRVGLCVRVSSRVGRPVPRSGGVSVGVVMSLVGIRVAGGPGRPAGSELPCPGPGFGDADLAFALAAHDAGGGVEQSVAQGLGFGLGHRPVEAEQTQPAQQVTRDGRGHAPCPVDLDRGRGRGHVTQSGLLAGANVVLDPGVRVVPGLESTVHASVTPRCADTGWLEGRKTQGNCRVDT